MTTRGDEGDGNDQFNTAIQLALSESRHEKYAMELEIEKLRSQLKLMEIKSEVKILEAELTATKEHHEQQLKLGKKLAKLKAEKKILLSIINHPGSVCSVKNFVGSEILNEVQKAVLTGWKPGKWNLIYRASTHGQASSTFHNLCDNKGPTYVIARSTSGFTFGGYAGNSWNTSNSYQMAPTSFLFVLNNSYGDLPTKLSLKTENHSNAMYCNIGFGPTFGGGHDLYIRNNPLSGISSCAIGHTFENELGRNGNTFTGTSSFLLKDYEVYCLVQ